MESVCLSITIHNNNNSSSDHMELVDYNKSRDPGERWSGFTSQFCHYSLCDLG